MKTTNYEMFQFMETNRPINQGLVLRLASSISEIGYIEARPVIVNESMTIIDGQHRFEACKKLGLPIFYEISNIDMGKAMIALNANQSVWRLQDYVESHAKAGIKCYQSMVEFEKKYKLGISNTIQICIGGGRSKDIRKGEVFELDSKRDDVAKFILGCKDYFSFYKNKTFVFSIIVLLKKTTTPQSEKVISKIQSLRQQATAMDYLTFYENILNRYKKNDDSRISLL